MWEQGEHVAVIGETGTGKTTLMAALLKPHRFRDYIIVLKTKRKDDSFDRFRGYRTIKSVSDIQVNHQFYILAPPRKDGLVTLRNETIRLLDMADRAGGWTIVLDELFFLQDRLKLGSYVDDLLTQGRSGGLTIVWGAQRPVRITRFGLSQVRHVFAFGMEDRDGQELGYATSKAMRQVVQSLDMRRYQYAYFDRLDRRRIKIGTAQTAGRVLGERS